MTRINEEKSLLINRISERIQFNKKSVFHYYGEKISKEYSIFLLNSIWNININFYYINII